MRLCMEAMDVGAIMTKSHVISSSPQTNERTNNKQAGNCSLALPLCLINSSSWLFLFFFVSTTMVVQGWRTPNSLIMPSINWFMLSKAYFMHLFWPLSLVVNCCVICFSTQTFNCAIHLYATEWQPYELRAEQLIDLICVFLHAKTYNFIK